jgi:hypothetical protein
LGRDVLDGLGSLLEFRGCGIFNRRRDGARAQLGAGLGIEEGQFSLSIGGRQTAAKISNSGEKPLDDGSIAVKRRHFADGMVRIGAGGILRLQGRHLLRLFRRFAGDDEPARRGHLPVVRDIEEPDAGLCRGERRMDVAEPIPVRYAYTQHPQGNLLYNKEGQPVGPFSTIGYGTGN